MYTKQKSENRLVQAVSLLYNCFKSQKSKNTYFNICQNR